MALMMGEVAADRGRASESGPWKLHAMAVDVGQLGRLGQLGHFGVRVCRAPGTCETMRRRSAIQSHAAITSLGKLPVHAVY